MAVFPYPNTPRAVYRTATDSTPGTVVAITIPDWARVVTVTFTTNEGKLYTNSDEKDNGHYVPVPAGSDYEFNVSGGQQPAQISTIWIDSTVASTVATIVAESAVR
tara:strand:+ start:1049 stop:1366 length:318 start_codon:yes stop_codon:yes gene_type:complete